MKIVITSLLLMIFSIQARAQTEVPEQPAIEQTPQPGTTGAYAFAFVDHVNDAKIGDYINIDLRVDAGKDKLGNVQGGMFRIRIPFAHWVEIEANAVSDLWQISESTRAQYGFQSRKNQRFDGDLNFKTKIRILKETDKRPAIGFQATMKTAAGDFMSAHRYTDSAGYEFSVLASKDLMVSETDLIRKVRLLTEVAFIAWDTNRSEQNDSYKASAAVQLDGKEFKMKVSFLGFYGWQNPRYDFVSMLRLEGSKDLNEKLQVYGQANFGLTKASTPLLVGGGVRYFLAAPSRSKSRRGFR